MDPEGAPVGHGPGLLRPPRIGIQRAARAHGHRPGVHHGVRVDVASEPPAATESTAEFWTRPWISSVANAATESVPELETSP